MPMRPVKLPPSWLRRLESEFSQPYMDELRRFLLSRKQSGATIYPPGTAYFRALDLTEFDQVKAVILGQDPYHGPGQAHGLSFSVADGVAIPPSLANIYKELDSDLGTLPPSSGDLSHWAREGVLLLNSVLTVEQGQAGAHRNRGWERFTDAIIARLTEQREHLAFLLWGSYAWKKGAFIDTRKHLVLKAPHPSPLSAYRGFFGSRPFSQTNTYLEQHGITPIDWSKSSNQLIRDGNLAP